MNRQQRLVLLGIAMLSTPAYAAWTQLDVGSWLGNASRTVWWHLNEGPESLEWGIVALLFVMVLRRALTASRED